MLYELYNELYEYVVYGHTDTPEYLELLDRIYELELETEEEEED